MARPLIILAPGSFTRAMEYDGLCSNLNSSGYETYAYDLPSAVSQPPAPAPTLAEDAAFFRGILTAVCDSSQNVVVLGHSYGGMVITEAVRGLTAKRVGKGRVLGMVYLTAAAVKEGQNLGQVLVDADMNFIKADGDYMSIADFELCAKTNFSDMSLEKGVECSKRMTQHSALSFGGTLQYAGYKDVDNVAYIHCTEDKTLKPELQQTLIDNINAARSTPAKVYKLAASHCPHASMPWKLAETVVEAVREFS